MALGETYRRAKVHGYAVAGGSDIAAASAHGNRSSTHRKCKICPNEPQQDVPINLAKPSNRSGLNAVFNEIGQLFCPLNGPNRQRDFFLPRIQPKG
ncbi:hypothetical protein [Gordonia sp. C13]|uniref:hypothetical protein n=1 Tax=Gordonia sp. C13 TaxID=2935078 RepID=UPI00200A6B33|nr:hypothetical protein [Gordonia sp. C13]MCK8614282.1 hypothetical protein [Gordonia sp. C13]